MKKILKLQQEYQALEQKIIELENLKRDLECKKNKKIKEIGNTYQDFFDKKQQKEFVFYKEYPTMSNLDFYKRAISSKFPLYDYGRLNAKELAEIIKYLYQFKTGKEYNILTTGSYYSDEENPHVHFIIGNQKTLNGLKKYNGKFFENPYIYPVLDGPPVQSLISIKLENASLYDDIDFSKYSPEKSAVRLLKDKQIFTSSIITSYYKSIREVLNFDIHPNDTFIAKVLISIIIYKRNNELSELSSEDYNHIFDVLFKEKVTIKEDTSMDFPNALSYVPRKR